MNKYFICPKSSHLHIWESVRIADEDLKNIAESYHIKKATEQDQPGEDHILKPEPTATDLLPKEVFEKKFNPEGE